MKSLITYIQESLIIEGGHSIEDAQPIRGDLAKKVADEIIKVIKDKFNCECASLGSVGKKTKDQTSGDIDIALEYDWDNYQDVLDFVKDKFNCPIGNINNNLHVFNIGYSYVDGEEEKLVQVDFMFTDNVEFAQFAYNSPDFTKNESKYKGMYQSALLMAIISNTPVIDILGKEYDKELFTTEYNGKYNGQVKSFWKLYFDQNQGLKAEHKSFEGKTKPLKSASTIKGDTKIITKNINEILHKCLGESATKDTCKTFENELSYIVSNDYKYKSKEQLEKIKDTFINDWQLKMKTSQELMNEFETLFNEEIKKL